MLSESIRKYINIINEADQIPVSQEELTDIYSKEKPIQFIKNTPVALVPFNDLSKFFDEEQIKEILQLIGLEDQTKYDTEYSNKGYVVFQWNNEKKQPDLYIANPEVVKSKYKKFTGKLPTDEKEKKKIPSLIVLTHLGANYQKLPFFVKKTPTEMISVKNTGLENKTIKTNWGTQTVQTNGFLVKEPNGHIYTVAPDNQGLPIGYIKI